jgi:hypothetical protein
VAYRKAVYRLAKQAPISRVVCVVHVLLNTSRALYPTRSDTRMPLCDCSSCEGHIVSDYIYNKHLSQRRPTQTFSEYTRSIGVPLEPQISDDKCTSPPRKRTKHANAGDLSPGTNQSDSSTTRLQVVEELELDIIPIVRLPFGDGLVMKTHASSFRHIPNSQNHICHLTFHTKHSCGLVLSCHGPPEPSGLEHPWGFPGVTKTAYIRKRDMKNRFFIMAFWLNG